MEAKHLKMKYWTAKRIVSAILSAVLLLGCLGFSATAWLTYEKKTNVRVFKGTSLEIGFAGDKETTYPLIPGKTYMLEEEQIPRVTIPGDDNGIDCYLYVLCEFYWYDLKLEGKDFEYPIRTMGRNVGVYDPFNDTYRNNNTDDGYIDYFGFDGASVPSYNTDSFLSGKNLLDIKDENNTVIGRRYLFGFRTKENNVVFSTQEEQFVYVLDYDAGDGRKITVNEFITKEQAAAIATNGKAPKMVFTGYAVQAAGLSRDDATELVANAIINGDAQAGILQ